ncbi:MAG: AsmA-like C-terminal region-containing protein [Rhizobiaceae bacterium]|nr:AsmA-like C-terminal region-containing protein [Rhizobiaceae bacterium]
MNFLFRTFILFGGLLVIALFAALIAPYWIDWEQFTDEFEVQASRVIGQPVEVGGDTKLRLLPLPFISFENLSVGLNQDGQPLMSVEQFTLKAELLPFLSGDVRIVEMTMLKPRVDLKVENNGTIAWTTPREPIVNPEQVGIENLAIENGEIYISGLAGNRDLLIDRVQGTLSAASVLGPWRIQSTADVDGVPSKIDVSTGSYLEDVKSIRLKAEVERSDQPYSIIANGPLRLENDVLSWSGDFEVQPHTAGEQAAMPKPQVPLPVYADGNFRATPQSFEVPEYRLEIGSREDPYVVTGAARAEIGNQVFFRIDAEGRQIDLDRIARETTTGGSASRPALETRLATLRSVIERIPVPTGQGEINISLPAIVAGDTFIRDVKTIVRPYNRGWDVRSLQATFPGNTLLEANGRVGLFDDFGFAGRLLLASRQPSGFAAWLSGEVSPQIRRLKTVGIDSQVILSSRQTTLDDLELRLDDAVIRGRLQRISSDTAKPALIAELGGNRINTEDLRALYSLARGKSDGELVGHDLNVKLNAELLETVVSEIPVNAQNVTSQIQVLDGSVSVEKFSAENLFGAKVESSGRIENMLSKPNGNMTLSIEAENAQGLVGFANRLAGEHPAFEPFMADAQLSTPTLMNVEFDTSSSENGANGLLLANGSVGGSDINVELKFDGDISNLSDLPISSIVSVSNSSPLRLLQQMGMETTLPELNPELPAPLRLQSNLKGTLGKGLEGRASAIAPGTNVLAVGKFEFPTASSIKLSTNTTLGSADIAPWFRATAIRLPIPNGQKLPVSAKFTLDHSTSKSSASKLSGQVSGTHFSGELSLQREGLARPRLEGNITTKSVDIVPFADVALARYGLIDLGAEILPPEELSFGPPLAAGYDARIALTADAISPGLGLTGQDFKADLIILDGEVGFQNLSMKSLGGELSGSANLKNADGTVLATANLLLRDGQLSDVLQLAQANEIATGKIQLTGSFESTGKSIAGLISNLSGNGFSSLKEVSVRGIDPDGFGQILLETDAEGFEINAERVNELAQDILLNDGFEVAALDIPYSVTRGSLKMRNVSHELEAARLVGEAEIDLGNQTADVKANLTFVPGRRDEISGADPQVSFLWSGPFGAMERTNDASLLEGYLSLRAFENSQRRVETLEARVIEKQRHLRQIALGFAQEQFVVRKAEEARRLAEELERKRLEEAARRLEEERKRIQAERLRAEEAARKAAEAERLRLEEEARQAAEAERLRLESEERARQEAERKRLEAERRLQEEAERQAAEEAARVAAERARQQEAAARAAARAQSREEVEGIENEPLAPLNRDGSNDVAPRVRNSIIDSLRDFLQSQ